MMAPALAPAAFCTPPLMTSPAPTDLTKLTIDRGMAPVRRSRRRRWLWLAAIAVIAAAGAGWYMLQPHPVAVQTTPVVTTYPAQQYVVLNATGYVVAQRKAAIASKAIRPAGMAGRRRRLARQGRRNHRPHRQSRCRRAGGECAGRGEGFARDARPGGGRGARRGDAAEAQRGPAGEGIRLAGERRHREVAHRPRRRRRGQCQGRDRGGRRQRAQCADRRRFHADPRTVRRRHRLEERQRRRPRHTVLVGGRLEGCGGQHGRHEHARSRGRCVGVEPFADQGRPAVRDHARCAARCPLSRTHQPHRADRRSRQGDGDDQGAVRADRSARAAGDEREGGVPVAGGDA